MKDMNIKKPLIVTCNNGLNRYKNIFEKVFGKYEAGLFVNFSVSGEPTVEDAIACTDIAK
jgi:hypothetical protein